MPGRRRGEPGGREGHRRTDTSSAHFPRKGGTLPQPTPQHRRQPAPAGGGGRDGGTGAPPALPIRTPLGPAEGGRDRTWRVSPCSAVPGSSRAVRENSGTGMAAEGAARLPQPDAGRGRAPGRPSPLRTAPRRPRPGTHNCVALPDRSSRLCGTPSGRLDMARRRRREGPGRAAPHRRRTTAAAGGARRGGAGRGGARGNDARPAPPLSGPPRRAGQSAATSGPPTSGRGRKLELGAAGRPQMAQRVAAALPAGAGSSWRR